MLQFGHDVGVVETSISSPPRSRTFVASIRPRRWSRGDVVVHEAGDNLPRHASIRPRRWSRGDYLLAIRCVPQSPASIRPRRWSRGDPGLLVGVRTYLKELQFGHDVGVVETYDTDVSDSDWTSASIRPRRWSRGDVGDVWVVARAGDASIRPRRWSRGDTAVDVIAPNVTMSFNSATTLESWRLLFARLGNSAEAWASIRPRRWSRGDNHIRQTGGSRRSGFNSATTLESWRRPKRTGRSIMSASLQFGHDVGVVETAVSYRRTAAKNCASIRPRRWSRGDIRLIVAHWYENRASIRPRRWSRGDRRKRRAGRSCPAVLQFGHDVGVVETSRPKKTVG